MDDLEDINVTEWTHGGLADIKFFSKEPKAIY